MEANLPLVQHGLLGHDFPRHRHPCWEIHLFTGGSGRLSQEGATWPLGDGVLTLTPPQTEHELEVDEALRFYYLQFGADRTIEGILGRLAQRQAAEGPLKVDPSCLTEVSRLKDRLDSTNPDRVASGVHGFRAWLFDLVAGRPDLRPDEVDRALAWVRQHLDRRIGLDDLVAASGLDRYALSRRFKARTGLPPLAYVHRSKVEAASFLLAGTDLSLAEVASRFGFSDEFHFGKVFKKWRGQTPGRWRRSLPPPG